MLEIGRTAAKVTRRQLANLRIDFMRLSTIDENRVDSVLTSFFLDPRIWRGDDKAEPNSDLAVSYIAEFTNDDALSDQMRN